MQVIFLLGHLLDKMPCARFRPVLRLPAGCPGASRAVVRRPFHQSSGRANFWPFFENNEKSALGCGCSHLGCVLVELDQPEQNILLPSGRASKLCVARHRTAPHRTSPHCTALHRIEPHWTAPHPPAPGEKRLTPTPGSRLADPLLDRCGVSGVLPPLMASSHCFFIAGAVDFS